MASLDSFHHEVTQAFRLLLGVVLPSPELAVLVDSEILHRILSIWPSTEQRQKVTGEASLGSGMHGDCTHSLARNSHMVPLTYKETRNIVWLCVQEEKEIIWGAYSIDFGTHNFLFNYKSQYIFTAPFLNRCSLSQLPICSFTQFSF